MALHDDILALDLLTLRAHTELAGDAFDPQRQRASIERLLPLSEVAVVRRDGVLVAYAMLQPQAEGRWFVTGFNTHPEHRSAAVFRSLFAQLKAMAARHGITVLRSNVYKTNRLSMAFHTKLGFQVTRENAKGVEFTASLEALNARRWMASMVDGSQGPADPAQRLDTAKPAQADSPQHAAGTSP